MVRVLYRFSLFVVAIELLVFVLGINYAGIYFSTPRDDATQADLIVVLGGGTAERLSKGIDLYKQGFAEKLLLTGFPELKAEAVPGYIKWRVQYLIDAGIPMQSLVLNGTARSSAEEAAWVKNYLITNKAGKAIIVSDPPHIRRLSYIYTSVFEAHPELSYDLVASEPVWWNSNKWWSNKYSAQFVILETVKFSYYFINNIISHKD